MNPGLPPSLWAMLEGRLWHATEPSGLAAIVAAQKIHVSTSSRYQRSFCRCVNSVSLFDFGPTATGICSQFHNWVGWLGHQQGTRVVVWLEVDRVACGDRLLDAGSAKERQDSNSSDRCKTFIPGVEACHRGPIPISAVVGMLLVADDCRERPRYCGTPVNEDIGSEIDLFALELPPPPPDDPTIAILRAGLSRRHSREG